MKIEKLLRFYTDEVIEGKTPNKEDYINKCNEKYRQELRGSMSVIDILHSNKELLKTTQAKESEVSMDNLERYLKTNLDKGIIDHAIRTDEKEDGTIVFYIHAINADSETQDFAVQRNVLIALK